MHAYLQKEAESTRGKVKRMLLEWGASLDQCGRKQEEIRKILRLKAECEGLAAEVKSRSMEKGFSLIEEAYDHNIAVLQEEIERKLTEKNVGHVVEKRGHVDRVRQTVLAICREVNC